MRAASTLLILIAAGLPAAAQTTVFINEIHYDNSGTDAGEAIEIAGPAGTDLTGWSIVLYNGNGGALYNTSTLVGPLDNDCSGWGLLQVPVSGLQNGAPDGIALVDDGSTVIQFLSYEGSFTATNGPAAGLTSTDIGVAEPSGTPVGHSLQLTGTGSSYEDFSWTAPAPNTFGDCNNGQTLLPPPVNLLINEVDSDTPGTDTLEFVELYDGGVGNSPLDGLVVVFMNGSDDASYAAFDLDGYTTDINGYFLLGNAGVSPAPDITFGGNGLQNGADAVALYQGDASDFPNDTPVTTNGLIDAIVYDTNDGDDAGLLVLLNAGQPQVNEGGQGDKDNHSNQRCPSGEGGARNTAGYFQATPSPAGPNQCGGPTIDLIINETDADTAGSDALEFVELYDGGVGSSPLDGFVVVFMNGSDDASYAAYDLDGFTTDASGYFVLGNPGVSPTPDIIFGGNGLQNGADAVALYWGDADDFLNDTPVTTVGLVDAIVYDTNDGDDAGLLVLLNAGEPQVNEDGAGDKDNHSNQRCPNGEGGARNTSGYIQAPASPAAENQCGGPSTDLIINETDADTPGSDSLEFVELYDGGAGNSPLDGLVVVFFNGNGDIAYNAFDLDGFATDANGYFLMGNPGVTPTPDITFGGNGLQNGADAVALYWGDAADFPNGTPVTTVGLIDAIVYDTNDSDDAGLLVLLNAGQPQVNEDGEGDKDNHSNQRCPNGEGGGRNTDPYLQRPPTPGAENWCGSLSVFAEIFEIQSAGAASPFDGATVTSLANVVTTLAPNGFFMQTPTDRSDGDINTSDGIFVFTGGAPGVAVGDSVDVTGEVDEFFGMTEITRPSAVTVVGAGVVPAVIAFDAFVPSPDPAFPSCAIEFECYEGMLIAIADGTVTGPNQRFGPDPVAEVHITAAPARTFREPGIEVPGLPGLPVWDGNPEIFELDPNKLGLPNQIIPAGSSFSAVGVLGFEFGGYELWPSQLTVVPAPLPRAVWPREPGEFTVATLNLFRLFDDIDDPPDMTYDPPRNDFVVPTAEYQLRLAKFSSHIREVLDAPDILAVQEAEKLGVLQDLAARIAADDPTISYTAYLVEGNDIGTIDVGFMVRDRIQVDAITQLGADETYVNPITLEDDILHDRPPLLLEGSCQLEFGSSPIAVLAVHMRSLSGIEGSDAERVRQKRFEQAESVAAMVQDIQTTDPGVRLIVAGDFNAYEFTDGYVDVVGIIKGDFLPADSLICDTMTCMDIVDPDLTDEILNLPAEERYSFIFRGTAQALDHALTSSTIVPEISAVAFGRGNADAAVVLRGDDGTEAPLPLRSSDHDGLVLYILNDEDDDGVPNDLDMCPGTVKPEGVPTQHLGTNRWALVDDDGVFDTTPPNGRGNGLNRTLTLGDTAGCSCEQIIEELDLGNGHVKFGCSIGVMENWMAAVGE